LKIRDSHLHGCGWQYQASYMDRADHKPILAFSTPYANTSTTSCRPG
jgi:hypothetical protein